MPTESSRVVRLKRIVSPDDPDPSNPTVYVDVPVSVRMTFHDNKSNAQDYTYIIDETDANTSRVARKNRVKNVTVDENGDVKFDDSNFLDVERPRRLTIHDSKDRGQERIYIFNNAEPPPTIVDENTGKLDKGNTSRRTHVVRYTFDNTPTGVPWIDMEYIDQFSTWDAKSTGQDTTYLLTGNPNDPRGPDGPQTPIDDPTDPYRPTFVKRPEGLRLLLPLDSDFVDPPWRLDAFVNIVNVSWSGVTEFEEASRIFQTASVKDTKKMTIVMFVRVPQEAIDFYGEVFVLDFGPKNETVTNPGNGSGVPPSTSSIESSNIVVADDAVGISIRSKQVPVVVQHCNLASTTPFTTFLTAVGRGPIGTNSIDFGPNPGWETWAGATANVSGTGVPSGTSVTGYSSTPATNGVLTLSNSIASPVAGTTYTFVVTPTPGSTDGTFVAETIAEQISLDFTANGFVIGKWNCIAISADTSIPYSSGPPGGSESFGFTPPVVTSTPKLLVSVNGVDKSPTQLNFAYGTLPYAKGGILPDGVSGYTGGVYDSYPKVDINECVFVPSDPTLGRHDFPMTIAPWDIGVGNCEFAIPVHDENINRVSGFSPVVELCAVQIWTDQALDVTDPNVIKYFMVQFADGDNPKNKDVSVNGIKMVKPSFAQEKFGKSAFLFDGGPSTFIVNKGSAKGDFTKVGDLKSFSPPPPSGTPK